MNAITDDHAALIVLEAENDLEPAPQYGLDALTVAVRNDNGKFLSNERIFSILNAIWVARSYSATTKKGTKRKIVANYDDLNLLKMLKYHYPFMPQIPYVLHILYIHRNINISNIDMENIQFNWYFH